MNDMNHIQPIRKSWKKRFLTKKILLPSGAIVLGVIAFSYYQSTQPAAAQVRYAVATAEKGMLVSSIVSTGQVSAENQVDVKAHASGDVLVVLVKPGQEVKKDEVIAEVDRKMATRAVRDAAQAVRDARINLQSAELAHKKLLAGTAAATLLSTQNALNQAERDLAKLQDPATSADLLQAEAAVRSAELSTKLAADGKTPQVVRDALDNAVSTLKADSLALKDALDDADGVLGVDSTSANPNFVGLFSILDLSSKNASLNSYPAAKAAVLAEKALVDALPITGADEESVVSAEAAVSNALVAMSDLLEHVSAGLQASLSSASFSQSSLDGLRNTIQSDRSDIASKTTALQSLVRTIDQAKTTFANSGATLAQARASLDTLKSGADARDLAAAREKVAERKQALADAQAGPEAIDVAVSQNTILQRQASLASAQDKLSDAQMTYNDYSVRAPFDGVVASVAMQVGDTASDGTIVATLITKQKIAETSLNEVDIAKVKVGQKTNLTFDAVPDLNITGEVAEVNAIGTVTQGVVNYGLKIAFDTQDDRIRPGMSMRAAIITATKADALSVPSSAVKTQGGERYVEVIDASKSHPAANGQVTLDALPNRVAVQVGLSSDTSVEITDGLAGGEQVVTQTINGAATTAARPATGAAGIGIPGLGGGTGNRTFIRTQ